MNGRLVDRYEIQAKLGEGGMGVVYKARDLSLGRYVAIKVLAQHALDASMKERFIREAKAASALNHPGIVTVHDINSHGDTDFIVMEWVEGHTLDTLIGSNGVGVTRTLRYGAAIADALSKAHAAGIVHRDIKPSNVIVTVDDRIKVVDFGLAKLITVGAEREGANDSTVAMTAAGIALGTAAYMSPEQARGGAIDTRSDIFSLGAVLYQMMTGRRPFVAESKIATIAKIIESDPPAPTTFAEMPADVERLILRCLRKDPARRYQTMADLKVAIDDLIDDSAAKPVASGSHRLASDSTRWIWGAIAVAVTIAAIGYGAWQRRPPRVDAPLRAVPLASLPGITTSPSFSPDASQVAFGWSGPDNGRMDVYVQQIGAGTPLRLTSDPADDDAPLWSPDGKWIAFVRGTGGASSEIRIVPPLGGAERKVADVVSRGRVTLSWCPDSRCIVTRDAGGAARPDALFVVVIDSGEKRQLTRPPETVFGDSDPAISPDGRWLAFRRELAPFSGELWLQPLAPDIMASGDARRIVELTLFAMAPRWLPNNREILFSAKGALWRVDVLDQRAPERLAFVGEDGVDPIVSAVRADGTARLAYIRRYIDSNIWKIQTAAPGAAASAPPVRVVSSTRGDWGPALSHDGRRLAFDSSRNGETEIWSIDLAAGRSAQLTDMRLLPGYSQWSPDGRFVAFHSNGVGAGRGDIFIVPEDGGQPRNLTSDPANDAIPVFSRDGQWIYFMSTRAGENAVWKMPIAGGPATRVLSRRSVKAVESIDGARLYFTDGVNGVSLGTLWETVLASGRESRIADNVISAAFEVVNAGVYFVERAGSQAQIKFYDPSSGRRGTIADGVGVMGNLCVSEDGRTIYFDRIDSSVSELMLVDGFR